jgi:4-alpha-glucanotransferase
MPNSPHIPHNFTESDSVVYTGTHDNNTIKGWYSNELDPASKKRLVLYCGYPITNENVHEALIDLALSSTAAISILQLQDVLGLNEDSRMNVPGTDQGNWLWRQRSRNENVKWVEWLKTLVLRYGRG